ALRAQNQLIIQRENLALTKSNLDLARDRVRAGSASNADVFRWEASLASARSSVLAALAVQQQAYDSLNRVLNRPVGTVPRLSMPAPDEPFAISADDFDTLINNPRRFSWFVDFSVAQGLEQAPELVELRAQLDAVRRDVVARRRAFWAPDISVQAQYSDNIDASGLGSGSAFDSVNDWSVSLNATWPLFDAGARRSQLSRAALQERQLSTQISATVQRIEQNIRAFLLSAQASYANIELSEAGAEASRKNLALVSDAYRQGALSIIDLLDAQNQSLQADLSANNAVHDFLLDIVNLQRATASFDFLLPADVQVQRMQQFRQYIEGREARRLAPGDSQ
ncbi:MAG: TolC family protein, partial [Pseudomonadota bacterium]